MTKKLDWTIKFFLLVGTFCRMIWILLRHLKIKWDVKCFLKRTETIVNTSILASLSLEKRRHQGNMQLWGVRHSSIVDRSESLHDLNRLAGSRSPCQGWSIVECSCSIFVKQIIPVNVGNVKWGQPQPCFPPPSLSITEYIHIPSPAKIPLCPLRSQQVRGSKHLHRVRC